MIQAVFGYYVDCSESVSLPLLHTVFNFHASIYVIVAAYADWSRWAWKVLGVGIFGRMHGSFVFGVGGFFLLLWVYSHSNYSRNVELSSCSRLLALSDSIKPLTLYCGCSFLWLSTFLNRICAQFVYKQFCVLPECRVIINLGFLL